MHWGFFRDSIFLQHSKNMLLRLIVNPIRLCVKWECSSVSPCVAPVMDWWDVHQSSHSIWEGSTILVTFYAFSYSLFFNNVRRIIVSFSFKLFFKFSFYFLCLKTTKTKTFNFNPISQKPLLSFFGQNENFNPWQITGTEQFSSQRLLIHCPAGQIVVVLLL